VLSTVETFLYTVYTFHTYITQAVAARPQQLAYYNVSAMRASIWVTRIWRAAQASWVWLFGCWLNSVSDRAAARRCMQSIYIHRSKVQTHSTQCFKVLMFFPTLTSIDIRPSPYVTHTHGTRPHAKFRRHILRRFGGDSKHTLRRLSNII